MNMRWSEAPLPGGDTEGVVNINSNSNNNNGNGGGGGVGSPTTPQIKNHSGEQRMFCFLCSFQPEYIVLNANVLFQCKHFQ